MAENENSGRKKSGKGTGRRGKTECKKVLDARRAGILLDLDADSHGQPAGEHASLFISWVGRSTRGFIPCYMTPSTVTEQLLLQTTQEIMV